MRKSLLLFVLFCIGTCTTVLWAQKKVSGVVMDKDANMPLIGCNVVEKGTTNGTVTDLDGNYTLEVGDNATLQFSYLGMSTLEEPLNGRTVINVDMVSDSQKIDEVVVTAMGIQRKAKSLTYATQQVSNQELTRAKDANMINSLQGKAAGLVITPNATGAGGSSKIILRGNKSAFGNNQPLIVVDGIPMNNPKTTQLEGEYEGRDGGDALGNLNPDDIASMNVLKGASAAALYGSMAANGVIMITTKRGRDGAARVDFSSNITIETPLAAPKLQGRYGAIKNGDQLSAKSWGERINDNDSEAKDRLNDFFRTGSTYINSITINGGTERVQSFMSYANTTALGMLPTNDFQRHNMTARETFKLFKDRLTLDASLSYITQKATNRPHGGTYINPLTGAYTFPVNGNWQDYKENFEVYDGARNLNAQNWYTSLDDFTANPYWVLNRIKSKEKRDRIMASITGKLKVTDWLNIQGRLSVDNTFDRFERKWHATTYEAWAPKGNGRYRQERFDAKQFYGDLMANFNKTWNEKWELNASVGTSFMQTQVQNMILDSDKLGLVLPNVFLPENIGGNGNQKTTNPKKRLNSVFGTVQFGYNGMIYLDVTGRNDWASSLAYTNNFSYFYPSVGLTLLLNEMIPMSEKINLLKVRGSYSVVGNDVEAYITHPMDHYNLGQLEPNTKQPFTEMKPEKMHSMEFGLDLAMFDSRLNFDITYYKTNNKNQYFSIDAPLASGYESYYINAGNIQNTGFESSISYRWDFNSDWSWKPEFNISYNDNKIKELSDKLKDGVQLGSGAGVRFMLKEGGSFGDIYGKSLKRENGMIVTNGGAPVLGEEEYLGNVNSDWHMGFGNTITYKDFNLYFLIDGSFGGNVVSMTQSYLDSFGVTEVTADARDNGGVDLGDGTMMDAQKFYEATAGKDKAVGEYVYSATNIRLRELSLGYTFRNLLGASKNLNLSFVARNLFFFYKDSPFDPALSVSTANGWQGFDSFGMPASRSYGINLKVTF
ncbi:SusC/RagA family TonB-linked outer membrane protein [Parabacteroides distasonis]|uniref:SusC/RagA family TonB-linked outer membrane protein n=1 Tax=Parabacteroides distasonis TaxID=823 RepID=UPI000EC8F8F8|nr:SusC/RagA family TonB-linked outer membrane protein [Parabacteroides distasonis]RHL78632.1 SusC/RagA family TonB-linked outer membrane protein [Parabacteroides distasonis]HCF11237.1 SusC/RagA family TonB-linked outer membrane protein [Parabacteroides distasonis]HCX36685.1 SusC/RagA family TonB-linked outer membrane protein [Parabacteroides distasonis]